MAFGPAKAAIAGTRVPTAVASDAIVAHSVTVTATVWPRHKAGPQP
jgi:hypothetical protein